METLTVKQRWYLVEGVPGHLCEVDGRMLGMKFSATPEGAERVTFPARFTPRPEVAAGHDVARAIAKGAVRKLAECAAGSHAEATALLTPAAPRAVEDTTTASASLASKRSK